MLHNYCLLYLFSRPVKIYLIGDDRTVLKYCGEGIALYPYSNYKVCKIIIQKN